ncbi:MAG: hypothetical protein R3C20_01935 [Planctomycetaceae bacterium]
MHNASYIKFVIAGVAVSGASILFCDWDKYFGRRLAQQEVSIDSASKELPLVKVLEEAPLLKPEPDSQYFSASVQILNQGLTSAKINSIHPVRLHVSDRGRNGDTSRRFSRSKRSR